MKANRAQLADIFGRADSNITKMVAEGMPFLSKPIAGKGTWEFDTKVCIDWFVKREAPGAVKNTEKESNALRLQRSEVILAEIKAATALRKVVLVSDAVRVYEERASVVKSLIRAIPGRVADKVAAESDPSKVLLLLKTEIVAALEGITNPKLREAVMDLAEAGTADEDSMPSPVLVGPDDTDDSSGGAPAAPAPEDPYDGY